MSNLSKTRRNQMVGGALFALIGTSIPANAVVTFSDFTGGSTISSSEMNTKLNALKNSANATVITVITSVNVAVGSFNTAVADCPAGYYAVGGGVDLGNVLTMVVTQSTPRVNNTRPQLLTDGQYGAPIGWQGAAKNNDATTVYSIKVVAICKLQ